ncbi:ATP-binding protein [candidate division WOR-3 bacterium]|nr:ATP-binding protein [candidate division WOR-3 bacterium]
MEKNELNNRYLNTQSLILQARLRDCEDRDVARLLREICPAGRENKPSRRRKSRGCENQLLFAEKSPIEQYGEQLERILAEAKERNVAIPLEKLVAEHNLNEDEKTVLIVLFFARLNCTRVPGATIVKLLATNIEEQLAKIPIIHPGGKLLAHRLIVPASEFERDECPLEAHFKLPDRVFWAIAGVPGEKSADAEPCPAENEEEQIRLLYVREPSVSFDMLVLPEQTIARINRALWQVKEGERAYQEYGIADKIPYGKAVTMLFYGPPGTGKTATAEAIAHKLGKKVGYVSYPQIYNRWFGDSEKNIHQVFEDATTAGCVLLFDEADACFGTRFEIESYAGDRCYNTITNILMQEVERFNGLLILTTNRAPALDPAFERRILLSLKFDLPGAEERTKIWRFFLKDCPKLAPDVDFEQLGNRYQLSGAEIKNAVLKAITTCAQENRLVTMADLKNAAEEEAGIENRQPIGF